MNTPRIVKKILPYVIMYGIAFLWIIPILWMADTAFKPKPEILSIPPSWIPSHFTMAPKQRNSGFFGNTRFSHPFYPCRILLCPSPLEGTQYTVYDTSRLHAYPLAGERNPTLLHNDKVRVSQHVSRSRSSDDCYADWRIPAATVLYQYSQRTRGCSQDRWMLKFRCSN